MKTQSIIALIALTALAACADGGNGPSVSSRSVGTMEPQMDFTGGAGCSTFRLSESAVFDDASGTFLTSGLVTIGDQLHTFTSIVYTLDANWDRAAAGKNFKSLQREVFTFENGDQLTFEGPTMSVPSSAPGMYDAFGSGKFVDGTGAFTGAHGSGSLKGMTMFAPGVAETSIATYNAELCL